MIEVDIVIVGAGLAGLSLARKLYQQGISFHLLEARERIGGRILSLPLDKQNQHAKFDLGPAWFWPGQPRLEALTKELGLTIFEQYSDGELSYEDEKGDVSRGRGYSSMQGSYRIKGGFGEMIQRMADELPHGAISLHNPVANISIFDNHIIAQVSDIAQTKVKCKKLILAIPPRVISQTIGFTPALQKDAIDTMKNIPTWMAGHAKIVAVYKEPFWRDAGLSGDAMSRHGPMMEIHDASPIDHGPYALFGFVGVPAQYRKAQAKIIIEQSRIQLGRIFGEKALHPIDIKLQDWAFETETATVLDHGALRHHPRYGLPDTIANLCGGRLFLGSTETAIEFGGYLEGALEASDNIFSQVQ